jgi:acetamidase/formamidase
VQQCAGALLLSLAAALSGGGQSPPANPDLSGVWEFWMERFGEPRVERCALQVESERLTGYCAATFPVKLEGVVRGNEVEFKSRLNSNNFLFSSFKGVFQDGEIRGSQNYALESLKTNWVAKRAAVRPAVPREHNFAPQQYYRVVSAAPPPALRVFPGDTIHTTSVDAGGRDEKGIRRAQGGNPLTGPFYVEGAMASDTLVVKLLKVRLNSDRAVSGWRIVPRALTPNHLLDLKREPEPNAHWRLDRVRGVAVLDEPPEGLKDFAVPLAPMVGGIAVAPPFAEGITTRDSGRHGGNMDYNQLREGTTIYLPVFQPGALLFIGDGHAAQGDGELTGDALETTLAISFQVDVIKDKQITAPRAENDEYLMAIGIAGSLDDALQRATSELARWLESDYRLNQTATALVLGSSIRYDVADLVGNQVSIVAKVSKQTLAQLKRLGP